MGGGDVDVELAVGHLGAVVRTEPHDELTVGRSERLVADVGRQQPAVGEEPAAVVLGVVRRALIGRHELADLGRLEVAEGVTAEVEDAPALQVARALARVLAGDEAVRLVREEADLGVDVEAVRVVGGVGDDLLAVERRRRVVGVEVVALAVEDEVDVSGSVLWASSVAWVRGPATAVL